MPREGGIRASLDVYSRDGVRTNLRKSLLRRGFCASQVGGAPVVTREAGAYPLHSRSIGLLTPSAPRCPDEVRRSEYRRLAGQDRTLIKGQRYTLLSRWENLSRDGRHSLKKLLAANRRLNTADVLKEQFDARMAIGTRST